MVLRKFLILVGIWLLVLPVRVAVRISYLVDKNSRREACLDRIVQSAILAGAVPTVVTAARRLAGIDVGVPAPQPRAVLDSPVASPS